MRGIAVRINAEFDRTVVIRPPEREWIGSPAPGVERCMLDRIGGEVARATSLVRFAPGASFAAHDHDGGEEYLVVEGTFSDETGDFPTGTYVRNPPGTRHAPRTEGGCTIFVKLRQFAEGDDRSVAIAIADAAFGPGRGEGVEVALLHEHGAERVSAIRFAPGARAHAHDHPGGEEILVLEGTFQDENGAYPAGTWIRSPAGTGHAPFSDEGCLLYVKHGHLGEGLVGPEGDRP